MQQKRTAKQQQLDALYRNDTPTENTPEYDAQLQKAASLDRRIKRLDTKIAEAQDKLSALQDQWAQLQTDKNVQEHIAYLRSNYMHSPNGLHYHDGLVTYNDNRDIYHNYSDVDTPEASAGTTVSPEPAPTPEDKADYAKKKQEYLLKLKNRTAK